MLVSIYALVEREIHIHGARSVRQASERLVKRVIRIKDKRALRLSDNTELPPITETVIADDGTLRQWYQTAKKCLGQPAYPALAKKAAMLEHTLPGAADKITRGIQTHRDWLASGQAVDEQFIADALNPEFPLSPKHSTSS